MCSASRGALVFLFGASLFACAGDKDAAEIGVSTRPPPPDASVAGYEYVARRTLGSVGLSERKGLELAEATALVDAVANELDRCAGQFLREGHLASGAARVEGTLDDGGHLRSIEVRVSPGADVAKNAVLCVITPTRQFPFSLGREADAGVRRFAIEAVWQPLGT